MYKIKIIPHQEQRYNTVGDYLTVDGTTTIWVSEMNDWRGSFLIALHEIVETALCRKAGITDKQIDDFDFAFDESREAGDSSEPGDHPDCPYRKQHRIAMKAERIMAMILGVSWDKHEAEISNLMNSRDD